jgi:thioredoxin 1
MKLIKFSAEWCQPCKNLDKELSKFTIPMPVVFMDLATNKESFDHYGIRSVPTMMIVNDNDEVVSTAVGLKPAEWIQDWIEQSVPNREHCDL